MRTAITIPQLGLMEDVTVVEWLKANGDPVTKGDAIAVLATDKVSVDLEAPADGILDITVAAGPDPVSVETILGYIIADD